MKKSFYNNSNNIIKKRSPNIINIDNKNIIKYNEKNNQEKKDFQKNKNLIINNLNPNPNINNKQRQIKTAKGSPLSINNKILKQISKINTKQKSLNIDKIPTVIFNINSNQIFETNYKNFQNSNESKSNNKSKSNENKNYKKNVNQCNLIKKTIKKENKINANIIKTKTQIQKKPIKKSINNNIQKKMINKNQIKENNSYKTNNQYNFYSNNNNNQKINIGTSLSLTSNKNNLVGIQYISKIINKNNINNFKTTPITTKNSKEKNIKNSNSSNHKKENSNDNKKINQLNGKVITMGPKKKTNQQKIITLKNNNDLNSLMKKFSISNLNKGIKMKNDIKFTNNDNLSNSKNITLIGKNSISNLSSLNNFYSINILSKSFANSKKNFKKNIIFYKTKVDTKIQNNNEFQKKPNKYFDNINNHNIFPITISHYKNNYININININKKNNIKI